MSRIFFGSCSSQHYPEQPFWPIIQGRNATAFIWGGDAVYGDDRTVWDGYFHRKLLDATPEYLRLLYEEQKREPGYRALLDTNISIFGTIDDHDYGVNNGDGTFPWRRENTIEFVRFLGLSEDSAMFRRANRGLGVYGVQVYDFDLPMDSRTLSDEDAGLDPDVLDDSVMGEDRMNHEPPRKNKQVAVFVLDIRTNRTPWRQKFPDRYFKDVEGDFLGDEQWQWFETALSRSQAAVNIVVTGLQVHAERYFDPNVVENWHGFEKAQHRLYQALLQPNVQAPILISGDVHKAQLMRKDCRQTNASGDRIRPLYEITTSGLTHSWGTKQCGRANDNPICHSPYHNTMFRWLLHFAHWISPWTEILVGGNGPASNGRLQYSLEKNVAELDFDWDHESVSVNILGVDGKNLLEQRWSFQDLTSSRTTLVQASEFDEIRGRRERSTVMLEDSDDWVCVHHRGIPNPYQYVIGATAPITLAAIFGTLPMWLPLLLCFRVGRKLWERRTNKPRYARSRKCFKNKVQ
jgi:PhoD-like phosphatase